MNIPQNLKYTQDDEWVRVEGEFAYVGITDYAQHELGDIVFVDVDCVGDTIAAGEAFGSIEASRPLPTSSCPLRLKWLSSTPTSTTLPLSTATPMATAGSSRSNPPTWPTSTLCSTTSPTPPKSVPNPFGVNQQQDRHTSLSGVAGLVFYPVRC